MKQEAWLDSLALQRSASSKSWNTTLFLSIALGLFGADRFYLGRYGLGVLKLFSCGGYLAWWIADVILLLNENMRDDGGAFVRRPPKRLV